MPGMRTLLAGLLIGALSVPVSAVAQEKVRFPWHPGWISQFDAAKTSGELVARLFRPVDAPKAPFVVFMHGCGGLQLERVSHWAKFFTQRGIGFMMVDSFSTRNVKTVCDNPPLEWIKRRADDAASALAWLTMQPYVKSDRVAIMGQSQGGTALLFALSEGAGTTDAFVAGLAMYPACIRALNNNLRLSKPVVVLIGSEDTLTPPADCERLQARQPDKGKIDLIVYPGAAHEFDNPVSSYLFLGKYRAGEHPTSRAEAQARVAEWIEMVLKQ
jgi:dienelactone hydrolase